MFNAVVRLLAGEGEFLTVDQTVLVAVKVAVTGHQRVERPGGRRDVPRRKQQLHTVKHAVPVRVHVVRVGRHAREVGLVFREEVTKRRRGRNTRPLLKSEGDTDGGHEPLR